MPAQPFASDATSRKFYVRFSKFVFDNNQANSPYPAEPLPQARDPPPCSRHADARNTKTLICKPIQSKPTLSALDGPSRTRHGGSATRAAAMGWPALVGVNHSIRKTNVHFVIIYFRIRTFNYQLLIATSTVSNNSIRNRTLVHKCQKHTGAAIQITHPKIQIPLNSIH
ncbi:hypothetical protein [Chromobacterium violaceum]|uniref:hypothetical protein n=1 Tax=Chromobacterium violaceum TaxID=536 RepID=UPI0015F7B886|nr:hypothetical protein [Chromobacterium violaceum]MBA8737348.1 hypothetical protein [Chromobacterium violaceum]